jgi:hypothetical protein
MDAGVFMIGCRKGAGIVPTTGWRNQPEIAAESRDHAADGLAISRGKGPVSDAEPAPGRCYLRNFRAAGRAIRPPP